MRRVRGPGIAMVLQEPMTSLNPVFAIEVIALLRDLLLVEVDTNAVPQLIARSARSGSRRKPDISAV
jgi:ABC-type microcin C transport system duplicated ATPase subunit YejF